MPSTTKTTTTAQPPQLMPEGAPGYMAANRFYQEQLGGPSVYQGGRVAGTTPLQQKGWGQAENAMGGEFGPQYSQSAKGEMEKTLAGDWMGERAQQAVGGLAQPIFERFENQTMPGI